MPTLHLPLPYQPDSSKYFDLLACQPGAVYLDSGFPGCQLGRYDICSAWPEASISLQPGQSLHEFLHTARQLLPAAADSQLPFAGGLIGYLGYSAAVPHSRHQSLVAPASIGLYLWALVTDHQQQSCTLVFHPQLPELQRTKIAALLQSVTAPSQADDFSLLQPFVADSSKNDYLASIEQIRQHIKQQDCQQINFTQRFCASFQGNSWSAYKILRRACPTPYASYLNLAGGSALLSCSPEQFLSLEQGTLETWPIKGTRARSQDPQLDRQLALELQHSTKDRNENLMIVELMRQEFAQCCQPDSITTPALCQLTSFANVHHLLSCIRGRLASDQDGLDALAACFPPGSISGTPKDKAIGLIDQLESSSREIYCGSVFYLDSSGNLDSSVCIRSMLAHQGQLSCWGGGGITSASDPQAEYQESIDKIKVLMQALEQALAPL